MTIMKIKGLKLNLGEKSILNGIDLDFWKGHVHALVGPNGAGKSTLASTIMGLEGYHHFDGEIFFKDHSLKNLSLDERARKGITFGWQEPARYVGLKVFDFIIASAKNKTRDTVFNSLELMGLDPNKYADRAVDKTLSGGERKKIEVASIVSMEPEFVLLDEPDSGIDVASLERIFAAIRFLKEQGSTIVLITHSLEVLKQAEHAFLLCGGRIVDKGITPKIIPYFQGKCLPCSHINEPSTEFGKEIGHE